MKRLQKGRDLTHYMITRLNQKTGKGEVCNGFTTSSPKLVLWYVDGKHQHTDKYGTGPVLHGFLNTSIHILHPTSESIVCHLKEVKLVVCRGAA